MASKPMNDAGDQILWGMFECAVSLQEEWRAVAVLLEDFATRPVQHNHVQMNYDCSRCGCTYPERKAQLKAVLAIYRALLAEEAEE